MRAVRHAETRRDASVRPRVPGWLSLVAVVACGAATGCTAVGYGLGSAADGLRYAPVPMDTPVADDESVKVVTSDGRTYVGSYDPIRDGEGRPVALVFERRGEATSPWTSASVRDTIDVASIERLETRSSDSHEWRTVGLAVGLVVDVSTFVAVMTVARSLDNMFSR